MNDPVIERIAREDPAVGSRSDTANELLARLRHEIGGDRPTAGSRPGAPPARAGRGAGRSRPGHRRGRGRGDWLAGT